MIYDFATNERRCSLQREWESIASKKEEKEIALYIHIVKGLMAGFGG